MSARAMAPQCLVHKAVFALISLHSVGALVISTNRSQDAQQPQLVPASKATIAAIGLGDPNKHRLVQCRNPPYPGGAIDDEEWLDGTLDSIMEEKIPGQEPKAVVKVKVKMGPTIVCEQVRKLDFYIFEWVGFQKTGVTQMPNSPHSPKAKCLSVGKKDRLGGRSLYWGKCQDKSVVKEVTDKILRMAQMFKLNDDGSVTAMNGQCIRRMKCQERGTLRSYVYDLGPCRDDMNLRISVKKPQANSMEHMREMGFLAHAVRREDCDLCGAYQLKNMCLGSAGCGTSWQAKPGWTKLASTYVGDDAVMGRSKYGANAGGIDGRQEMLGIDFSGIGQTRFKNGQCGTMTTDIPTKDSFYYLLRAGSGARG